MSWENNFHQKFWFGLLLYHHYSKSIYQLKLLHFMKFNCKQVFASLGVLAALGLSAQDMQTDRSLQNHHHGASCGTHDPDRIIYNRMMDNRARMDELMAERSGAIRYIPTKMHLVAQSDGTGRVSFLDILDMLCKLNTVYSDQDLQFYLGGSNNGDFALPNRSDVYNHSQGGTGNFWMNSWKNANPNSMNLIVGNIVAGGVSGGTTLGYYNPAGDWIFFRKDQMNGTATTAAHEVGHYFTLNHPFYGLEGFDYFANGNNYSASNPPPSSINGEQLERQARTGGNCATAADGFCDTYPDYNFGLGFSGCSFTNVNAVDPTGVQVTPNEENYMGYFLDACQNTFSLEQKQAVMADVISRGYNNPPTTPSTVNAVPTLIYPQAMGVTSGFNSVTFDWDPVPNATHYILEIYTFPAPGGSAPIFQTVVTTDSYTYTSLSASRGYQYRVKAYNRYSFCAPATALTRFNTPSWGVSVEENEEASNGFLVYPNPATDKLFVNSKDNTPGEYNLSVVDMNGRVVMQNLLGYVNADQQFELNLNNIPSGVYIVNIASEKSVEQHKLVVSK